MNRSKTGTGRMHLGGHTDHRPSTRRGIRADGGTSDPVGGEATVADAGSTSG